MMNKVIVAIVLAVLGLGAIGAIVVVNNKDKKSDTVSTTDHSNMNTQTTTNESVEPETIVNEPQGGDVAITIQDFAYKKATVTVKKGTKVTWTNQDSVKHDVTADAGDAAAFTGSGKLLAKGESYSFTFNQPGTYTYNCSPHPYMKGTITVVD